MSRNKNSIILSKIVLPVILIVVAVFIGASRVPSGDLIMYEKIYTELSADASWYISKLSTQFLVEPMYYLTNIIASKFFLKFSIFQGLIFAFPGLLLSFRKNKFNLIGLIFYFCFPLYLSLNLQIIRQWIGFAILLYSINNNKGVFYFVLAALFHVTCWFYVGVFLIRNMSLRNMYILMLMTVLLYLTFSDIIFEYVVFKVTKESLYGFDVTNGIPTAVSAIILVLSFLFGSMKVLRPYLLFTFILIWFAPNGEIQFRYMYFSIMSLVYVVYSIKDIMTFRSKISFAIPVLLFLFVLQVYYISLGPYSYKLF